MWKVAFHKLSQIWVGNMRVGNQRVGNVRKMTRDRSEKDDESTWKVGFHNLSQIWASLLACPARHHPLFSYCLNHSSSSGNFSKVVSDF